MIKSKFFFLLALATAFYFLLLALNAYIFNYQSTALGIVQELVTLPLLLLQISLCVLSFIKLPKALSLDRRYFIGTFGLSFVNCGIVLVSLLGSLIG